MTRRRNPLPKHCSLIIDRHGKSRIRFRKGGFSTYLPYPPIGDEFQRAYAAALAGVKDWTANIGSDRTRAGSFDALAVAYYRSVEFTSQRPTTQKTYRGIIERFRALHGDRPVRGLRREHVKAIMGGMADRPTAANNLLKVLKIMLDLALDNGWIDINPARGVKGYPKKTAGFHSWTDDEIAAFEARHPSGSKARLALALLLYTAQRRGDVARMGWQHVRDGRLHVVQGKTGAELALSLHPALVSELEATARANMTFLVTEFGAPFSDAGFGNWFRDRCREAGLVKCSAHGLRKAAARRMAEAGMSADIIKSVTGHTNLRTVSIYTDAADQARLADHGIAAIGRAKPEHPMSNLSPELDKKEGK